MKRLVALSLSLLLLCSCTTEVVEEEQPVVELVNTDFGISYFPEGDINPLATKNKENLELYSLVYEGLFELDENFIPVPVLCETYTDNVTEYTFTIKDGLLFSDGSQLTAADVAHSINLAKSDSSYFSSRLANISSAKSNGNIVTINLYNPNAKLPSLLDIPIIKKGSEKQDFAIGTGPYYISYDKESKEYSLCRNTHWHGGSSLPYSKIPMVTVSSVDDLVWNFESLYVDYITVDPTGATPYQFRGDYLYTDIATTSLVHLGFNHGKAIFQNPLIRRAISCCIDRKSSIEQDFALMGHSTTLPVHPICANYDAETAETLDYSKENAFTYFVEAGFQDANLDGKLDNFTETFTILVNSENKSRVALAKRISESLTNMGITVTVREESWDNYCQSLTSGNFDMYIAEANLQADFNLDGLIRTGGTMNYGKYASSATDVQLLIYNAIPLSEGEQMTSFINHFAETCPIVPILFKKHSAVTHKNFFSSLTPTSHNSYYKFNTWKVVE